MPRLHANVVRLHTRMLSDRTRTQAFLDAIAQVVRPGDVVVDVGTGTGILALAAARAGARRVYAIEAGPVRRVAAEMFARSGHGDRITLLSGRSTKLELPERADVLVTETFGNGALSEQVLGITTDARERLLKPGARMVPRAVTLFALPVAVPQAERARYVFTPRSLRRWNEWYGIDFSPLADVGRGVLLSYCLEPAEVKRWKPLSAPLRLLRVNLEAQEERTVDAMAHAPASKAGTLSGLVMYFELQLSDTVTLTTRPDGAGADNHWLNPVYFFMEPVRVREGDTIGVEYRYSGKTNQDEVRVNVW